MNKHFNLLLTLLLLTSTLNAQDIYRVTADKLRVRATNDTESKVIGFVPQNENVVVLDSADAKYFKVKLNNGEGWVSSEFLTRISPAPIKKAPAVAKTTVQQTVKNDSQLIFVGIVGFILLGMLVLIFMYLKNNVPLLVFSALVVLAMGYFSFTMLLQKKEVVGKYASGEDVQYPLFNFNSKDSVEVIDAYADSIFTAAYKIDGDMIKFKQQENTFLLMIRDNNTLIGEGFTKGVFKKK